MADDAQALLREIYQQGALIATVRKDKWFALFPDDQGAFWLCSGGQGGEETRSPTNCADYEEALEAFLRWWSTDFEAVPAYGRVQLRLVPKG